MCGHVNHRLQWVIGPTIGSTALHELIVPAHANVPTMICFINDIIDKHTYPELTKCISLDTAICMTGVLIDHEATCLIN